MEFRQKNVIFLIKNFCLFNSFFLRTEWRIRQIILGFIDLFYLGSKQPNKLPATIYRELDEIERGKDRHSDS